MSKVYLTQDIPIDKFTGQPKYNIVGAQKYGKVEVIFPGKSQMLYSPAPFIMKIRMALSKFNPEEDYLLLSGDPAIILTFGLVIAEMYGKVKVLKWDRQEMQYYPVEINLKEQLTSM